MFTRLFGGKKKENDLPPPPPSKSGQGHDNVTMSLENLDNTIDLLEKREALLDKKMEQELARAKDFLAKKNKNGAVACMKRKKMYEDQISKIQAQKNNMETMKFTLQETALNQQVLLAQKRAGQQLGQLNKGMNADQVEEDMDKVREAMDQAKEVTDALTQPIDGNYVDEDELLKDLMLEPNAKVGENTEKVEPLPELPTVPHGKLPEKKAEAPLAADEADALAALEAELNSG